MSVNKILVNNLDSNYTHSIFDISEYTGKSYSTLSDALNDIPIQKQKGGMTIRYIQNNDNMYVQFRLMATIWSTNAADWQGVDKELVAGSHNLAESGVVYNITKQNSDNISAVDRSNTPLMQPLASFIDVSKYTDTLYIADKSGNVIAKIDAEGISAKNITSLEENIANIDTKVNENKESINLINAIFKEEYTDTLYIADKQGNIIAELSADRLRVKGIETSSIVFTGEGGPYSHFYEKYELFTLGDSLTASGQWQAEVSNILGLTFSQAKNIAPGLELSTGGTKSGGDGFDNGLWRTKHLIDGDYIEDDGENAIIMFSDNNSTSFVFDKNAMAIVPTEPIDMGLMYEDWGVEMLQSIPLSDRKINGVLKMLEVTSGKNMAITHLPSSDGAVKIRIKEGGTGWLEYYIQVSHNDTLNDILDKILEYNYTRVTDTLADDGESVDFVGEMTSGFEVQFVDTDNTGMTVSITDTNSAKIARATYFRGDSVSDWEDTSKWLLGSNLDTSTALKSMIEMVQRTYPKAHIFILGLPIHMVTAADYLLPNGTYDSAAYYNNSRMEAMRTRRTNVKEVADFYSIPYLDVFGECGIGISNMTTYYYASANVHPRPEGYKRFGETIANQIIRYLS